MGLPGYPPWQVRWQLTCRTKQWVWRLSCNLALKQRRWERERENKKGRHWRDMNAMFLCWNKKGKKGLRTNQVNKIQLKHTKTGSNICAQILPISTCSFAKTHGTKITQFEQTLSWSLACVHRRNTHALLILCCCFVRLLPLELWFFFHSLFFFVSGFVLVQVWYYK